MTKKTNEKTNEKPMLNVTLGDKDISNIGSSWPIG